MKATGILREFCSSFYDMLEAFFEQRIYNFFLKKNCSSFFFNIYLSECKFNCVAIVFVLNKWFPAANEEFVLHNIITVTAYFHGYC